MVQPLRNGESTDYRLPSTCHLGVTTYRGSRVMKAYPDVEVTVNNLYVIRPVGNC